MTTTERLAYESEALEMPAKMAAAVRVFLVAYSQSTQQDTSFPARALRHAADLQQDAIALANVGFAGMLSVGIEQQAPDQEVSIRLLMPRSVLTMCAADGAQEMKLNGSMPPALLPLADAVIAAAADESI